MQGKEVPQVFDDESARSFFLESVNRERAAARLPPVRLEPDLDRFAGIRVAELVASPSPADPLVGDALHGRAKQAGYDAQFLSEMIVEAVGREPAAIASSWSPGYSARSLVVREDIRDLGIGIGHRSDGDLYVFLFALSKGDSFAEKTRGLANRERLRSEMLTSVSAERRKARRLPLRIDGRLERAAQRHADDMLARGYYGHETPEGVGPRERAAAAGYEGAGIGENLAQGQYSVEEVMDGWMKSPGHRRELLEPSFSHVGFGFAHGRNGRGYQTYWVQLFGTPMR
ncbi:hypothetical protein BH18GEM1_BH18GEM1_19000 [soil metagenome]